MTKESAIQENSQTVVVSSSSRKGYFIFAQSLRGELAEKVYEGVRSKINSEYKDLPAFSGRHWSFDSKNGIIKGSSSFLNTLADAELTDNGLYVPSVVEARILDKKGKLSNGVYRDFGVVMYSSKGVNEDIAESLDKNLNGCSAILPLIFPFGALSLEKKGTSYGVKFVIKEDKRIVADKNAREIINKLDYKADNGVRRLNRVRGGDWDAGWYWDGGLAVSFDVGRVDWVCGEATREKLEDVLTSEISRDFTDKKRRLKEEMRKLDEEENAFREEVFKEMR